MTLEGPTSPGPGASIRKGRGGRALLSLLALLLVPLSVAAVVACVVATREPTETFTPVMAATTRTNAPTQTATSKSNWPVNQNGENLSTQAPGAADTPGSPTAAEASEGDPEIATLLGGAGISDGDIRNLGVVGMQTGYLWQSRAPTYDELQSFAYMVLLECQDVASGAKTWADSASEAVSTGATEADAQRMVSHLQGNFCP